MKKIIIALLAVFALSTAKAQSSDSLTYTADGLAIAKIKTSAVCDMCKDAIEKAMAYEKGVKESNLNVDSKILTVKFDPKKTSLDRIRKAVTLAGYDADQMPADKRSYDNLDPCCKKDARH